MLSAYRRNNSNALSAQIFDQEALTGCTSPDSPTNRPWPSQLVQRQLNLQNRLLRSLRSFSSCTQGFGVPKHLCHHALGRLTEKWTFRAMDGSKQDPIHMHTSWQKVDTTKIYQVIPSPYRICLTVNKDLTCFYLAPLCRAMFRDTSLIIAWKCRKWTADPSNDPSLTFPFTSFAFSAKYRGTL